MTTRRWGTDNAAKTRWMQQADNTKQRGKHRAECGGKDKALRSLLVGHGELTGATGPSSCPARTKVALSAEQERGLCSQESGCMLSTMEKTACSKAEFWIQLFGKHLQSQNLEPRVCEGRGGQFRHVAGTLTQLFHLCPQCPCSSRVYKQLLRTRSCSLLCSALRRCSHILPALHLNHPKHLYHNHVPQTQGDTCWHGERKHFCCTQAVRMRWPGTKQIQFVHLQPEFMLLSWGAVVERAGRFWHQFSHGWIQ